MLSKSLFMAIAATIFVPAVSNAAQVYQGGTLTLSQPVTLPDQGGRPVTLQAGTISANLTVAAAGLGWGDGYIIIETPADKLKVKIPRKTYASTIGRNFNAYSSMTGYSVNLVGSERSSTVDAGQPITRKENCTFDAQTFYPIDQTDNQANAAATTSPTLPAKAPVYICVYAAQNGKSKIAQVASAQCSGSQLDLYQPQQNITDYELDFVDPKNAAQPIGKFTYEARADVMTPKGSQNDCQ